MYVTRMALMVTALCVSIIGLAWHMPVYGATALLDGDLDTENEAEFEAEPDCTSNDDCAPRTWCVEQACVALPDGECRRGVDCPDFPDTYCEVGSWDCRYYCQLDFQCESGEYCNPDTSRCEPQPGDDDSFCLNDADCPSGSFCVVESHECQEHCNGNDDCEAGEVCVDRQCVPGGGDPDSVIPDGDVTDSDASDGDRDDDASDGDTPDGDAPDGDTSDGDRDEDRDAENADADERSLLPDGDDNTPVPPGPSDCPPGEICLDDQPQNDAEPSGSSSCRSLGILAWPGWLVCLILMAVLRRRRRSI